MADLKRTKMLHPAVAQVLRHFRFRHLPEPLQSVSTKFAALAHELAELAPDSPEMTVALRKLMESKDCAVRAVLPEDEALARFTVNGEDQQVAMGTYLTYEDVCEMATEAGRALTVVVKLPWGGGRTLTPGDYMLVRDGMHITAVQTGGA